jgi:hypothetical protein
MLDGARKLRAQVAKSHLVRVVAAYLLFIQALLSCSNCGASLVKLRDHPMMCYRGVRNWPPVWTRVAQETVIKHSGEIGILKQVDCRVRFSNRAFLTVEYEGESYIGTLLFDDPVFCRAVGRLLQKNIDRSIKSIGDLDFWFTL